MQKALKFSTSEKVRHLALSFNTNPLYLPQKFKDSVREVEIMVDEDKDLSELENCTKLELLYVSSFLPGYKITLPKDLVIVGHLKLELTDALKIHSDSAFSLSLNDFGLNYKKIV
jgi:hypothetical protein